MKHIHKHIPSTTQTSLIAPTLSPYLFRELVDTRHADFLSRGRTVQFEGVIESDISAGCRDRMSDGEEDGSRKEERRLTDSLEQYQLECSALKQLNTRQGLVFKIGVFLTLI